MEDQIQVPYRMMQQQQQLHGYGGYGGGEGASAGADLIPPWFLPSIRSIGSSAHHQDPAAAFFSPRLPPFASGLQFPSLSESPGGLMVAAGGDNLGFSRLLRAQGSSLFGTIHAELGKLSAQEIMDAKALAASRSHSEAERRRRERINGHLAKLRSMLPNTTKTDKASLLAEVIHHVKELKRQTSEIAEESSPLPTEVDELTVDSACDEDGKFLVRASFCCDDRPDLIPDLISAVKALRLRILKAEITTVGGRIKNVLVITGGAGQSSEEDESRHELTTAIQEALRAVVEQTAKHGMSSAPGGTKRQRTTSLAAPASIN